MATTTVNLGLSLDGLSNVDTTGKNNGDILVWNSSLNKWVDAPTPSVTPSGTSGQVQFNNAGAFGADSAFHWDNTNKRLGIGTSTPSSILNAIASNSDFRFSTGLSNLTPTLAVINTDPTSKAGAILAGTLGAGFAFDQSGQFSIISEAKSAFTGNSLGGGTLRMLLNGTTGNVGIGTGSTLGARLDVRAQGALSTDIAFRVRNSADTADLISFRGDGSQWIQSVPFIHAGNLTGGTNAAQSLYIGYNSRNIASTGLRNVIIGTGSGSTISTNDSVCIGHSASAFNTSIAIGSGATASANNYCVMGSESCPFTSMAIGTGGFVTAAANVQNMNLFVGGVASGFTLNTSAASKYFRLSAQNGSGTGEGAPIQFATAPSGASGFSSNANVVFMEVRGDGRGLNHYQLSTPRVPSASITDGYIQYSNDVTAGNAAPHFRTENGSIIKLYQQSSAGITTVADIVTVLQNLGFLS